MRQGNGSSAYALSAEETAVSLQHHKKSKKRSVKPIAIPRAAKKNPFSLRLIGNILLVCVIALVVVYRYSCIVERDYEVSELKKQSTALADENKRLQVEIDSALNLDNVEQIAKSELGMVKPENYQKVYVTITGDDYVELAEEAQPQENGGKQFYAAVIQTLGNVLEYLY